MGILLKLNIQFADVESAFACARISRGTSSAGYSHGIDSHPSAKKVLKTNRKVAATMPHFGPPMLVMAASIAIETAILINPTDPPVAC